MRLFLTLIFGLFLAACETPAAAPPHGQTPPPHQGPILAQTGEMCGGIAAIQCGNPQDYCAMEAGQCGRIADGAGMCTRKSEICPMIYMPVCGCDGKTYSNGCVASGAGASVAHQGACEAG